MYYCTRCGAMHTVKIGPVDYWTACFFCKKEFRVRGSSWIRTWVWHLFGRHEGYNDWDMWRTWI